MANAKLDQNSRPSLTAVSNADSNTIVPLYADPITHRLLVDSGGGGSVSFVDNETVSGSGTSWTLANTPVVGSQHVYAIGQRLYPTVDYTISGVSITTNDSYTSGQILADYRK